MINFSLFFTNNKQIYTRQTLNRVALPVPAEQAFLLYNFVHIVMNLWCWINYNPNKMEKDSKNKMTKSKLTAYIFLSSSFFLYIKKLTKWRGSKYCRLIRNKIEKSVKDASILVYFMLNSWRIFCKTYSQIYCTKLDTD